MATHDYVIANGTGAAVRSDLNNALAAIVSQNSSATEPTTTYAYMPWADTTAGVYKIRNGANSGWITLYQLDGEWTSIALENGTAAAPSLYFKDSGTDTGIYSSGTDAVDITTAGVRRVGISSAGEVTVYGGNVTLNGQGDLRFADSDSSNWVAFQAPATIASNITWTLPNADGTSGQSLTTNGSGALSWSTITPTIASRSDVDGVHTTGTVTSGSASLTVASATGIVQGMVVVGEGITPGTTVSTIVSTTVTLSANAKATLSGDPVSFYDNTKALSPGSVGGQLCRAWVNFDGTANSNLSGTYSQSGTNVEVTLTNHGLTVNSVIYADITSGTAVDGTYAVSAILSANVFTYTAGTSLTTSGNITLRRNTIRASYNVSSVTDNGTGDYTVNFTTAMLDANYSVSGTTGALAANNVFVAGATDAPTTSAYRLNTRATTNANVDTAYVNVAIFR